MLPFHRKTRVKNLLPLSRPYGQGELSFSLSTLSWTFNGPAKLLCLAHSQNEPREKMERAEAASHALEHYDNTSNVNIFNVSAENHV